MRYSKAIWVFLAGVTSGLAGCSDDAEGSGDTMSADTFVQEMSQAHCSRVATCCSEAGAPIDPTVCEASVSKRYDSDRSLPFHGDAASRCLAEVRAVTQACAIFALDSSSCRAVFRGAKPLGASCERSEECAQAEGEESFCTTSEGPEGVCTRLVEVGLGEGCNSSPDDTYTAYTCDFDTQICQYPDATCAQRIEVGQSCDGAGCVADAYCDATTGTCVAKRQQGEPCTFPADCVSSNCAEGTCGEASALHKGFCEQAYQS